MILGMFSLSSLEAEEVRRFHLSALVAFAFRSSVVAVSTRQDE